MIVLDTTVLVYAVGAAHELRGPCRRLIDAIGDGRVNATTTVEVLQEFSHVFARRRSRREAANLAADFATLLAPLVRPEESDLRRGLEMYVDHPLLGAFDAVLAATVVGASHLTAIVSADPAFSSVSGLTHLHPASDDLARTLTEHPSR